MVTDSTKTMANSLNLRRMVCETNVLSRSDCSAALSQGATQVMVAANGPAEVKFKNAESENCHLEVQYRSNAGQEDIQHRLMESLIKRSFVRVVATPAFCRSAVYIYVQEMTDRGGLLACSINASCLALITSGVELNFTVAAVHCIMTEDGAMILDPDHKQLKLARSSFTFVFDSIGKNTVTSYVHGSFTFEEYEQVVSVCRKAVEKIFDFYRKVSQNITKVVTDDS
ncbi:exosome complex component RRP46 [Anopheles arabiensis]|uniref:Exoribonuclease phosphorolytic domain-containing protein n=2 Tax=gambiae species complex TaxID=44542 RepID=A0A182HZN6_ANOAR|nr:exosome complex component RRP46 [Anopheles arabiensis]XP_308011.6 exosome complex component RRP46 [Anopheles gambiae]